MIGTSRAHTEPDIEIRAAPANRLAHGAMLAIGGFVALLVTIALIGRGTVWAIVAGASLAVWVAYYYRLLSLSVVVRGDVLEARNLFATRRINREAVGAVTLGESSMVKKPNQTVVLALDGGQQVVLDACARTMQSRRKRRRVEDYQRRLAQWSGIDEPDASVGDDEVAGQ
ncbi:MAG: hypothetical protein ACLPQS_14060 [Acidimicrobiales bacterium]